MRSSSPPVRCNLPIAALWPHAWPIWLQAVLMVLVVDFLRYWLHRAAHQNDDACGGSMRCIIRSSSCTG